MISHSFTVLVAEAAFLDMWSYRHSRLSAMVAIEGGGVGLGTAMSVLETTFSFGTIMGPLASGLVIEITGLRSIFLWEG